MAEVGSRIWWAIRTYARDDDHADDLAQDCWTVILDRLHRYGGRGSFSSWAIAVAKNVCRMRLRKTRRAGVSEIALEDAASVPDSSADPEEELVVKEQREILSRALGELPDRERDAIVLRILEERTAGETARAMGMSRKGARSLVLRGMSRLRAMEQIQQLALELDVTGGSPRTGLASKMVSRRPETKSSCPH